MTKLKQERLVDSRKSIFLIKIFMAGLFLLSALPFSFGQDFNFRNHVSTKFDTKQKQKSIEFRNFLDSIEIHGKEYFDENCSQNACLVRNQGLYLARQGEPFYFETYLKWFEAYEVILTCEVKDPLIHLQILLNLESLSSYKDDNPITLEQIFSEILLILDKEENYDNIEFDKLAAGAHYRFMEYYRYDKKDYDRALSHGMKSISIYNKYPIVDVKPLRAIASIASTYISVGNNERTIYFLNEVLKYAKQINNLESRYTSEIQFEIARYLLLEGNYIGVDSMHLIIKNKYPNSTFYKTSYQQARKEFKNNNFIKANHFFLETLDLLKNGNLNEQALIRDISNYQARIHYNLDEHTKAITFASVAMNETSVRFVIDSLNNEIQFDKLVITEPLEFLYAVNNYLKIISKGDLISEEGFISTIDKIDSIYFDVQPTLVGPLAASLLADYYHDMVGIALKQVQKYDLNKYEEFICYYLSSGKSLSLFSNFVVSENIPENYQSEFNSLISKKNELASLISAASKNNQQNLIDSLANAIYSTDQSLKKIYIKLNEKDLTSEYRNNRYKAVSNLKKNFNTNQLVLDFFEYEDDFYAYSFHNNTLEFHNFQLPFIQDKSIKNIYKDIGQYIALDSITNQLSSILSGLLPEDITNISSIIIIPDGSLLEVPFETILFKGKELIHQFPIHYFNSINDHYKRSSIALLANKPYVGFGLNYNDELLKNINSSKNIKSLFDNSFRLASLPNAIQELKASNSIFKGDLFTEELCTSKQFADNAPDANIIHIANHVLLNNSNSFLSSIVFAENNQEQLFNALDVKALNLNAQLAILSSCNSGVGENFNGNGLRSIGQSFFEAGCQSVIVNLWEAGDKSSKKIISGFMNYLNEGMKKSEALRKAKLDFLDQASAAEKHPKFWANIILIGNDDSISFKNGVSNWIYFAVGGIILLVLGFVFAKNKKEAA